MKALGKHLLAEFYDCDQAVLDDVSFVESEMNSAAIISGATVVKSGFHRFLPHGVSGVVIVSESHLTIHTWPEYGYAAVDVFTCGDHVDPWKAFDHLKRVFNAQRTVTDEFKRGKYNDIGINEDSPFKVEAM
ncbi:MAG TPA: adenosylmethionine decarboxylase [Thermotogota bacterium]|nr:adenosylmethionine decarboxylase [Thermotogota bacterium]HPJ88199.1 adenosylmethionine decarboxylase [Thermotogota bacterium]HPR95632.1 adenosylmethionine decarboxylase [Thermotogota bacterium]